LSSARGARCLIEDAHTTAAGTSFPDEIRPLSVHAG